MLAVAIVLAASAAPVAAEPGFAPTSTAPDAPPRSAPTPPPTLPPSWDLDGLYLWIGPTAAASHIAAQWDSTIGGDVSVIRVREHELLGAIGGSLGASRWTARGGGRIWLDGVVGTPLAGHMVGLTAGPIVELSDLAHPRGGASIGAWAFVGVTPFARVGTIDGLGTFVEVGLHVALPAVRSHVDR